jgi:transcription antitermination factor NusG
MLRTFVQPVCNADRCPCDLSLARLSKLSQKWRNFTPRISLYLSEYDHEPEGRSSPAHAMTAVSDFRWFAVRCRRGMETLVDFKLRTMLIETLLPLAKQSNRQPRRTSGSLAYPLFAGYLFANFCAASSLRAVALSRGVLRVVSKNGAPVPVNEAIITSLRQHVGSDGFIGLCDSSTTRRDDLQTACDPIQIWLSVFQQQLSDERRVRILIRSLQEYTETSDHARNMRPISN